MINVSWSLEIGGLCYAYVGRVSDQGILHTEIQTEDRDLTTLPNLYLITHPLTVLRSKHNLYTAQDDCELPRTTWYQSTRHTFASHWAMAGGSVKTDH